MNYFVDLIHSKYQVLTPVEKKVADGILKYPEFVFDCNIQELSEKFEVSRNAVTRFCKDLGFKGYSEFQYEFKKSYRFDYDEAELSGDNIQQNLFNSYSRMIASMNDTVNSEDYARLIQSFLETKKNKGTVHIISSGYSVAISDRLKYILNRHLIDARLHNTYEHQHEIDYIFKETDCIVFITITGKSVATNAILNQINALEKPYYVLTTNKTKKMMNGSAILLPDVNKFNLTIEKLYSSNVPFFIILDYINIMLHSKKTTIE